MTFLEIIGYCGSLLIAISLTMKSFVKLRWINLAGASTFATYGLLIGAYPVVALNGFITLVDLYFIIQMYRKKDYFEILEIHNRQAAFLKRFLDYYESDILRFFPEINLDEIKDPVIFLILRNMLPVGLFIGEIKDNNAMEIKLDYVIPGYRDFKMAKFMYNKKPDIFQNRNVNQLHIETSVEAHIKFLKKIGFKRNPALGENWFLFELSTK